LPVPGKAQGTRFPAAGAGPNSAIVAETDLTLSVSALTGLDSLNAQATALRTQFPAYDNALKAAGGDLDKAIKAKSLDKAIDNALKATDDLLGISVPEIMTLRQGIDSWLRDPLMRLNP